MLRPGISLLPPALANHANVTGADLCTSAQLGADRPHVSNDIKSRPPWDGHPGDLMRRRCLFDARPGAVLPHNPLLFSSFSSPPLPPPLLSVHGGRCTTPSKYSLSFFRRFGDSKRESHQEVRIYRGMNWNEMKAMRRMLPSNVSQVER